MKRVTCSTIIVDCCRNNPTNIRYGEPEYIGFDFFVRRHEEQDMILFILKAVNDLSIPLACLSIGDPVTISEDDVFTKEKIWDSLTRNAAYIIEESQRIYNKEPKNKEEKRTI